MSEKIRKLKDTASRLIAKGKLGDAADEYVRIVKLDPRDLTARQKLAEIYARMGRVREAVLEYQSVAGSYAADGLLLKAIAVCKIILQIDPAHKETQHILAELSTRRRGEGSGAVAMPKAMSTALAPGAKRSAADIRGMPASQLQPRPAPGTAEAAALEAMQAQRRQADDEDHGDAIAIDVSFDANDGGAVVGAPIEISIMSGEGVPVVVGTSASQEGRPLPPDLPPDEAAPTDAAMLAALQGFAGAPHVEPPPVPQDEPAFAVEEMAPVVVGEDESDIIELTEPAQIDVDQVPPIPLFSDLPREAFITLTERMDLRVAGKDEVLVQEGERGTSMFIIIQGRVVVKRTSLELGQPDILLAELSDGAFFGEMALLSDAPRMASVVCADDTMLFEISRELLADITTEYPSVGEVMKRFHKNRLLTNLLKTSPIFQPFSTKDKKELIERFKSRSVDEGTYLITREHPGEGLYVLLSGRCDVLDAKDQGGEVLLAELKEGDVFGEMSMLWHKKTCASVRASSPCVVLRLPRESFNEIIMTHPQILETLTALSERRQKLNQELKQPDVVTDFLV